MFSKLEPCHKIRKYKNEREQFEAFSIDKKVFDLKGDNK